MKSPVILSTESSEYFARLLLSCIPKPIEGVNVIRDWFGVEERGERYLRLDSDDRMWFNKREVIYVASIVTNGDLNEVICVGGTLSELGAHQVTYVVPWMKCVTMDRAAKANEIVTAKRDAEQLSNIPAGDLRNRFLFLDLHTEAFEHFFLPNVYRRPLRAEVILCKAVEELGLSNFMFGSADLGRPTWVKTYAKYFKTGFALIDKNRDFKESHVNQVIGDVRRRTVVVYDDLTHTAKTLANAGCAYLAAGAEDVYAVLSHLALDDEAAIDRLLASPFKKVITTNSHPMTRHPRIMNSEKIIVMDSSSVFAEAIV